MILDNYSLDTWKNNIVSLKQLRRIARKLIIHIQYGAAITHSILSQILAIDIPVGDIWGVFLSFKDFYVLTLSLGFGI